MNNSTLSLVFVIQSINTMQATILYVASKTNGDFLVNIADDDKSANFSPDINKALKSNNRKNMETYINFYKLPLLLIEPIFCVHPNIYLSRSQVKDLATLFIQNL